MKSILKNIKDCIKDQAFAVTYDWQSKKVVSFPTEESYFDQIFAYRDIGLTIRCECYANVTLKVNGKDHYIYMIGYGDMRRQKFMHGQNPIAQALDKCMFDYVFLFAEEKQFVRTEIIKGQTENAISRQITKEAKYAFGIMELPTADKFLSETLWQKQRTRTN